MLAIEEENPTSDFALTFPPHMMKSAAAVTLYRRPISESVIVSLSALSHIL